MRYQPLHERSPRARAFLFHDGGTDLKGTRTHVSARHQVVFTRSMKGGMGGPFLFFHPPRLARKPSRRGGWQRLISKLQAAILPFQKYPNL